MTTAEADDAPPAETPTHQLEVEWPRLADLHRFEGNPRRGDAPAIARSLEVNGQYKPITVNRGTITGRPNEILAGNHTADGAELLEWETIAAVFVDVTHDEARRIVAADNRLADLGTYDTGDLVALLTDLPDREVTGYTDAAFADLVAALEPPEAEDDDTTDEGAPGPRERLSLAGLTVGEPAYETKLGQVWQLGRHTLVVADVHDGHRTWAPLLTADHLFWPYPSLLAPFVEPALGRPVLMVQPNLYLAGWLITKWARIAEETPVQVSAA